MAIVMSSHLLSISAIIILQKRRRQALSPCGLALHTRLVRQKPISPNNVFLNLLASRPHNTKDCLILLDLMLTSTPSTAKWELGFSATNHLKCNLRTTLGENTLSDANALFRPCNEGLKDQTQSLVFWSKDKETI